MAYKYNCNPSETDRWKNLTSAQDGTVKELVDMIDKHHIALMIRPTGFGKTHMMIELAKQRGYTKVLYLYPIEVIKQSIEESYHPKDKDDNIIPPSADGKKGIKYAANEAEHKKWPQLPIIEFCSYDKMLEDFTNAYRFDLENKNNTWAKMSKEEKQRRKENWDSLSELEQENIRYKWITQRFEDIELLILDEAHRTGADGFMKYWPYIKRLANSKTQMKKEKVNRIDALDILGATATPIRTESDVDIEDEIFKYTYGGEKKSARITDFGFEDCWRFGVMQRPYYIRGILDKETEKAYIIDKAKQDKQAISEMGISLSDMENKLDDLLENVLPIHRTILTGIKAVDREGINNHDYIRLLVFHDSSKSLIENHEKINNAIRKALIDECGYTDLNIHYILSDIDSIRSSGIKRSGVNVISDRDKKMEKDAEIGRYNVDVIHSIDMLNMGYHVGKVTGIITMRATGSEIIYYQQIGRCISVKDNNKPLIIDLANAAAELLDRTTTAQREDAARKIQKFIDGCDAHEGNSSIDELYKYINMCFSTEPIDEGLLEFWYFDRKAPIYFIAGINRALGKKETLSSILLRMKNMCQRKNKRLILDEEFCLSNNRIHKTVKEKIIIPQRKLLEDAEKRQRQKI